MYFQFIKCFCSTLSSGINGMAATMLSDIAQPLYRKRHSKPMSDRLASILAQGLCKYSFHNCMILDINSSL